MAKSFSQQQWQWLTPRPSGAAGLKIVFNNSVTGYILSNDVQLLKTIDQGVNWQIQGIFPNAQCMDIKDSTAVIAGNNGALFISPDNGNSWSALNTGISQLSVNYVPSGILAIQFLNKDTGFACREYNDLIVTHDGGKNCTAANTSQGASTIAIPNDSVGYIAGEDGFISKRLTWNSYSPTYTPVTAVSFPTPDTGYITTWNNLQNDRQRIDLDDAPFDGRY
jgi:photosystem II stability/assembly factor-like uncharacterized protein